MVAASKEGRHERRSKEVTGGGREETSGSRSGVLMEKLIQGYGHNTGTIGIFFP